mmetsp:Transcript_5157/g.7463  ORF Transcript_5157/g.7463 Transcript_5157/m.7463 type:complete len:740 (+) Transcript_5157:272-2491(+)|eukprot:CAMPEP_0194211788 /NCGR_PEP_ID=MMETSP0156-20130528/11168_1 /TAXON_ID=33649 /ORGANISM="Thalassionema nitzschioides, Strain L26-B" /LENGTH=739 /DNA_ID=CAMNT_0038939447 /DNA_START=216 /DNA_END=2435 /DNA_ORIENTATION=+
MPYSQDSTQTSARDIEDKEKLCILLESKLTELKACESSKPNELQEVRMSLCEKYSHILMENPAFSLRKGLTDRLWEKCFYEKISHDRKKLAKLISRQKNRNLLESTLQNFKKRLGESIEFYSFIINFYSGLIEPSLAQSQRSDELTQDNLDEDDKAAVVSILYKFQICVGDLYRYNESSNDALRHYEQASLLSPGQGNPYNQMAVLEQQKDSTCNALYYYARSIKASYKVFQTSSQNVLRLYELNRQYLKANPTDGQDSNLTKKAVADLSKAQKTAASKRFNANFVDLQRQLTLIVNPRVSELDQVQVKVNAMKMMDTVITSLDELLAISGLGDTLLSRMVVINAFTANDCGDVAKAFVFRFGAALADRVDQNLKRQLGTAKADNLRAIRGLTPLLITCDHVLTFASSEDQDFQTAEEKFWSKACNIANACKELVEDSSRLSSLDKTPKEYQALTGFTPFESFIPKPQNYISFDAAKDVATTFQSTKTKKKTGNEYSASDDNYLKLFYFLAIMEKSEKVFLNDKNLYSLVGEPDEASVDAPMLDDVDIIGYQHPQHGGGPALLVPGAMLVDMVDKKDHNHIDNENVSLSDPNPNEELYNDRPLPLTASLQIPNPLFKTQPIPEPTNEAYAPVRHEAPVQTLAPPPGLPPPPGLRPPPGFASSHVSLDFLSEKPTQNPFVVSKPLATNDTFVHSEHPNSFLNYDDPTNHTGFLESQLIQDLWGEEPITKNPFFEHPANKV